MVDFVDTYTTVDDLWLMCRENFAKFIRVVSEICVQTDTLVRILESTTTAEKTYREVRLEQLLNVEIALAVTKAQPIEKLAKTMQASYHKSVVKTYRRKA